MHTPRSARAAGQCSECTANQDRARELVKRQLRKQHLDCMYKGHELAVGGCWGPPRMYPQDVVPPGRPVCEVPRLSGSRMSGLLKLACKQPTY